MAGAGVTGVDLNLVVALQALLEARNVTHAAAKVNMSQPAMSAALARLRTHFGDELLHRVGRRYELTELGEELIPAVARALDMAETVFGQRTAFNPGASSRHFTVALSDYAITVLAEPLLAALAARAPDVTVEFAPMPAPGSDMLSHLMRCDAMIGPLGFDLPGQRSVVFRDQYVCLVGRTNPWLRDGALTLDDLAAMHHAASGLGGPDNSQGDRVLADIGIERKVEVTVHGLLPLPFAVAGTDLCAFVPRRLARMCAGELDLVEAEVPFDLPELVEAVHWHPARAKDPAMLWLRGVFADIARGGAPPSATT
ncbi:LysR family transcriptional regulator [Actinoplanes subglobosus]|uniref:LysR family transcriptional regulator n=1 Tax=Actinoplanes subglobosus TaxID=1547892 RepID=A0ABV8IIZ1_9ACTN